MKIRVFWCAVLFCAVPLLTRAAISELEADIAAVREKISVEEQINIELKTQLAAKETEVSAARIDLRDIEGRLDAFKREHHLE